MLSTLLADFAAARRCLATRPVPTLAIVLTLGVGLGAAAAMFTVTDSVLLRPLPYPDDTALVRLTERYTTRPQAGVSLPAVNDWAQLDGIASLGAYEDAGGILRTGGEPLRVEGQMVSPGFFPTMGVAPAIGRTMGSADPFLDADPKIVLSDHLWRERFGGRPDVIGQLVQLDVRTYTVIGVMPPVFEFPERALFWITLPTDMDMLLAERSLRFTEVIARMTPDTDVNTLESRLSAWATQQRAASPKAMTDWQPHAWSLRDDFVGTVRTPLLVTFGGVGLLLLVVCCNVASLLLAQGQMRQRSLAVRVAMGATRHRLVRQLLIEGAVLSAGGTALALLTTLLTQRAIIALSMEQIPRIDLMHVDWRVFVVVSALGIMTTFLCALGPALVTSTIDPAVLMGRSSRTSTGRSGRLLPILASAEVALAIVLIAAAGLLVHSYHRLKHVDVGFEPANVLVGRLSVPTGTPWNNSIVRRQLYDTALTTLRGSGAVVAAGVASRLPLEAGRGGVDVRAVGGHAGEAVSSIYQEASEGYLEAIGAQLSAGRSFLATDRAGQSPVAVINEALADHLFPGTPAVGRTVEFQYMRGAVHAEVIGVVKPVRYDGLTGSTRPEIYTTFRQAVAGPMSLVVRSSGPTSMAVSAVRAAVAAADPTKAVTLDSVAALADRLEAQFVRPRFFLTLIGTFAVIGLLLASLGLYGMLSCWTVQHRRELGVRLALGATREQVAGLVVKRGLIVVSIGLVAGLAITMATGRYLESLLFGVAATDPATLLIAAAALLAAAAIVCAVPGRQAARVDPIETLRA